MPYKEREKQARFQRDWMKKRRKQWLRENGPCVQCGSTYRLEVDHKKPTEKVSHRVWSWTREKRERELRKCQVLCHSCHKKKSLQQVRGEKNVNARLTEAQVREIHRLGAKGLTQLTIAERFPVSRQTISDILRGVRWRHIYLEVRAARRVA